MGLNRRVRLNHKTEYILTIRAGSLPRPDDAHTMAEGALIASARLSLGLTKLTPRSACLHC